MKTIFFFTFGLFISVTSIQSQWTQVGSDIGGEAFGDESGWSVSLNSDGSVVAIGALYNDENGTSSGQVRIYKNVSGTWTQVGSDIDGEVFGDESGWSVSLSSDGSIVAIGEPFNDENSISSGRVRIYKNVSGTWTQIGENIVGETHGDLAGYSVSLNSDGSIVAIGARDNDENGSNSGQVRIYKNVSGTWTQVGQNINGEAAGDKFGASVSLSSDGSIVAVGAYDNDGNGSNSGHVRVYKNVSGTWTQVGQDINGEAAGNKFGTSVSLSSDGSIVAIGTPYIDSMRGQVRIYKNVSGTWTQVGQDINGEETGDWSGWSISLSSDGSIIAIGAPFNSGSDSYSGQVRVYKNVSGTWTQVEQDIDGKEAGDRNGISVSLSSNGSIIAIGAPYLEGNNSNPGHVRVYKNGALNISDIKEAGISIYPNPSTGIFNIKNAKGYNITITDIVGKIIYHNTATVNEQVHLQQNGIYIINFKSQTNNFSSKIIVN